MEKFLKTLYSQIKFRVTKREKKSHLYLGLPLLPKEEFIAFGLNSNFTNLYEEWLMSGKDRKLVPTVDRIDSSKGYTLDNMEWKTLSENSKNIPDYKRKRLKENKYPGVRLIKGGKYEARVHVNYEHKTLGYFDTPEEASQVYEEFKAKLKA